MVKIAYIEADGAEHVVEVKPGLSIMEAAVKNNIPGILGECGGICACGTCRVYVDHPAWQERTGQRSDLEKSMIDFHEDQIRMYGSGVRSRSRRLWTAWSCACPSLSAR